LSHTSSPVPFALVILEMVGGSRELGLQA
jgi:hypothetical protein